MNNRHKVAAIHGEKESTMTLEQKKALEAKLTALYTDLSNARRADDVQATKRLTHFSQGMAYVLLTMGYEIIVENGTVSIKESKHGPPVLR